MHSHCTVSQYITHCIHLIFNSLSLCVFPFLLHSSFFPHIAPHFIGFSTGFQGQRYQEKEIITGHQCVLAFVDKHISEIIVEPEAIRLNVS